MTDTMPLEITNLYTAAYPKQLIFDVPYIPSKIDPLANKPFIFGDGDWLPKMSILFFFATNPQPSKISKYKGRTCTIVASLPPLATTTCALVAYTCHPLRHSPTPLPSHYNYRRALSLLACVAHHTTCLDFCYRGAATTIRPSHPCQCLAMLVAPRLPLALPFTALLQGSHTWTQALGPIQG